MKYNLIKIYMSNRKKKFLMIIYNKEIFKLIKIKKINNLKLILIYSLLMN